MSERLESRKCVPCSGGVPPLRGEALANIKKEIDPAWRIIESHHLERDFSFPDFQEALEFVNRVGVVAETEQHHPDITLSWGRVGIKVFTHHIDGLSESDFILAAKIDRLRG